MTVSVRHLKTSESFQNGLTPTGSASARISVTDKMSRREKTIANAIATNMTAKRGDIVTTCRRVMSYVRLSVHSSLMDAPTHQGSRNIVSMGLVFTKSSRLWRLLKNANVAYTSTIQYGCAKITVAMNMRLTRLLRNGLILIQAITLCRPLERWRQVAATDSHHPYVGLDQNRL